MSGQDRTLVAGVVGWPIGHSRSPRLHGYWLRRYGIDGAYVPLAVRTEDLETAIIGLAAAGFAGINVTVPHKEAVLKLCNLVDPFAQKIGAVNTLVFGERGIIGSNSDAFGFLENLRSSPAGYRSDRGPALVIGAGGAGRGVVAALLEDGVREVRLTNRTQSRSERILEELSPHFEGEIRLIPWEKRAAAMEDVALLVNATSLGMVGQPHLDLDLDRLPREALVTDIVYTPLETRLLSDALRRGNPVVDGLGMLLHQARPGFSAWFGVNPEVTEALRKVVLDP